jgi:hypothetical protein
MMISPACTRPIAQEEDRQTEHQPRPNDPVLNQGEGQDTAVAKYLTQLLVADLCERGYIIRIRPIAIGMDVVPTLSALSVLVKPGTQKPMAIPSAIAVNIQTVR